MPLIEYISNEIHGGRFHNILLRPPYGKSNSNNHFVHPVIACVDNVLSLPYKKFYKINTPASDYNGPDKLTVVTEPLVLPLRLRLAAGERAPLPAMGLVAFVFP